MMWLALLKAYLLVVFFLIGLSALTNAYYLTHYSCSPRLAVPGVLNVSPTISPSILLRLADLKTTNQTGRRVFNFWSWRCRSARLPRVNGRKRNQF